MNLADKVGSTVVLQFKGPIILFAPTIQGPMPLVREKDGDDTPMTVVFLSGVVEKGTTEDTVELSYQTAAAPGQNLHTRIQTDAIVSVTWQSDILLTGN